MPTAPEKTPQKRRPKAQPQATSLLKIVTSVLEDGKAEDTMVIDLAGKTSIADFMVVTSGRSQRHVGALADQLSARLRDTGAPRARIEGLAQADWVLFDCGDIIVHIFRPEVRNFYNLEKMWSMDLADSSSASGN